MKAGIFLSLAAVFFAVLMGTGFAYRQEAEPEPTVLPTPVPSERTVEAILIHRAAESPYDREFAVTVSVDSTSQNMTLEEYLTGVVLGEMPTSFDSEALKAQAVAARTYTLQQLSAGKSLSDDPSVCQAFLPADTVSSENLQKVQQAVRETAGEVLTYEGSLITATYFSCSGGQTEDASAVWGNSVPYLKSVESPGEEFASVYESTVSLPLKDFMTALGITDPTVSAITYTTGGGVETITIGGALFYGTALRDLFSLRSTLFSLEITADTAEFSVRGNGHRVGLSQYGAQAMAQQGYDYQEILKWYYTDVEITTLK